MSIKPKLYKVVARRTYTTSRDVTYKIFARTEESARDQVELMYEEQLRSSAIDYGDVQETNSVTVLSLEEF